MKRTLLVFLLLVSSCVLAQKIERTLIIKDMDTQLPLEDVTVLVAKTKQILISNKEGEVSFIVNGNSNIQLSHPSYVSMTVRPATLKQNGNIIYLKSSLNKLDELVVTRQHPQKILKSLVANSIKKFNVPARLKVYSYYTDGLLNFQIVGDQKKLNSTILVEQNRSFGVVEEEVSADLLGYNLNNIMENYYTFKYLAPLLDPKAKDSYYFLVRSYSENDAYYVLTATPLDNSKGLLDEFKIIYDNQKNLIIEVSSKISEISLARNSGKAVKGAKNIYMSNVKTTYRVEEANYLVTTNFSNQNYTYREPQVFKDKSLINKGNSILTNYWDFSGLAATDEEQRIIAIIEKKM